jgi:hypothetical protein
MSLTTHSLIYYGHTIDEDGYIFDFSEGGAELNAVLGIGSYTLTEFADELARALNDAGDLDYTVTVNRATRKLTIAASGTFQILCSSGSHVGGVSISPLAGFTGANRTGSASYLGNAASGSAYSTQFIAQNHVASGNEQGVAYGTQNKSASGKVEVVSFGNESFVEFNLKYVTNIVTGSDHIRDDATGVEKLQALMQYLIVKGPIEFMPDEDDTATFESLLLETTPEDSKGLKYKLKEMYGQGLPGFFETGVLKFRVVED